MVSDLLRSAGYEVIQALDGTEALKKCKAFDGKIDMLVTDVVMPKMGGYKLAAELKKKDPELEILYMSGHADPESLGELVDQPPGVFLQKPFSTDALRDKVKGILRKKRKANGQ